MTGPIDQPVLTGLFIYPLKSGAAVGVDSTTVESMGPRGDRRYMLVDRRGGFVTQRTHPKMALINAQSGSEGALTLSFSGRSLTVAQPTTETGESETLPVTIWDDTVVARVCSSAASADISEFLGDDLRLVHIADDTVRQVDLTYARPTDAVGFADGFPFLALSEGSLADLNGRLSTPVSMRHFRPNLVIGGTLPFAEDSWLQIRIGTVVFDVVKPCARCTMTTVDPRRGVKTGREPLATLASYRQLQSPQSNEVFFGQNLVHRGSGVLRVGHKVEVLRTVNASPTIETTAATGE